MKMIKIALLGTAALAAVSVSAQANSYEALDKDIAAMNFSPVAVADVPAGSSYSISGYVKAGLVYSEVLDASALAPFDADKEMDIKTEGGATISGSTDTSVGKIGASMTVLFSYDPNTSDISLANDGFSGSWEFAEGMKLSIGRLGDLASIGHGIESNTNRIFTGAHGTNQGGNGDFASFQLGYTSGPIGFAIAVHDTSKDKIAPPNDNDAFGVSGEMTYSADIFKIEVAGGYYGIDNAVAGAQQKFLVGAGLGVNVADGISLGMGAQYGETHVGTVLKGVSGSAKIALDDAISFQMGAGWEKLGAVTTTSVVGGIYYSPVSQLTLGLEADWFNDSSTTNDGITAALVAKYSF